MGRLHSRFKGMNQRTAASKDLPRGLSRRTAKKHKQPNMMRIIVLQPKKDLRKEYIKTVGSN